MLIQRIEHVQLAMPEGEEEKARVFYRDLLGISEAPKSAHLAKRGGAWFENGETKIHLGVDENFIPAKKAHVAFLTGELEEIISRSKALGFRIVADDGLEGYDRVYIYDPFGNRLEFMQKSSEQVGMKL